jgi:nucleoside 2-deoxyribosyltransferase
MLRCLKKIDDADAIYVVNPKGYVGKSVSVDIGYAYAMKKPIYVMHAVDDPPVMDLTSEVLRPKELIDFLKGRASSHELRKNSRLLFAYFFADPIPKSNFLSAAFRRPAQQVLAHTDCNGLSLGS